MHAETTIKCAFTNNENINGFSETFLLNICVNYILNGYPNINRLFYVLNYQTLVENEFSAKAV